MKLFGKQIGKQPGNLPTAKSGKSLPLSKKQLPTILGLTILVVSLVAGLLLFSGGTGVFAPRATPETTPKNVKVTNVTDKSFTVSFYTDEATSGFVKFGDDENSLRSQASDDRDQLSGTVGEYQLHYVTVRGLNPNTSYFYVLGTGSVPRFDNSGVPFNLRTLPAPAGVPPASKTIYGTVVTETGAPAEGSIVSVLSEGVGEMSSLVKSSGSWAVALANARQTDGSGYADVTDETGLNIIIQGVDPSKSSVFSTTVAEAQPTAEVTLGQNPEAQPASESEVDDSDDDDFSQDGFPNIEDIDDLGTGGLDDADLAADSEVLDLTMVSETDQPTVNSTAPLIKGVAAPGVAVTIEVNSDHQVIQTLVADENGEFSLDLAALGTALEPGEHTVSYSYTDPNTGEEVSRTQTFLVADTSSQLAQADTTNDETFGSGEPVPVTTPTPTPTTTPTPTEDTTKSAVVSTDSGTLKAGSVENTIALVVGGVFFIIAGAWSWWLAHEVSQE